MSHIPPLFSSLKDDFTQVASTPKINKKRNASIRLSFRVSQEEKDQLTQAAGALALSSYIRKKLFGNDVLERATRYQKKQREPSVDTKELARLLGMFGQSELATAILALSLVAAQGNLDVTPEIEDKIESACDDIHTIKLGLIMALGVKPQESSG